MNDYLPFLATLLAAIITASVGAYVALKNINKNNIVDARLKWLEKLKEYISDFLKEAAFISRTNKEVHVTTTARLDPQPEKVDELNKVILDQLADVDKHKDNLFKTHTLILLNLNDGEKIPSLLQTELRRLVDILISIESKLHEIHVVLANVSGMYKSSQPVPDEIRADYFLKQSELERMNLDFNVSSNKILHLSKIILKIEWEKSKSGTIKARSKSELESMINIEYIKNFNNG